MRAPPPKNTELLALPASAIQEQLWSLDQTNPGDPSLNMAVRFSLSGPLDPFVLERALNEVIQRHEILRSTFTLVDVHLKQFVAPSLSLLIPVYDLREMSDVRRNEEAERLAASEAYQSFSLSSGPLLRARLIRCEEHEHILLITLHQIVCDAWSVGVLITELGVLYEAFLQGRPSPLPSLEIQHADYTLWQRENPSERACSTVPPMAVTAQGNILSRPLPGELKDRIRQFSQRHNATRSTILLGAVTALLHRFTGDTSLVVATPATGRDSIQLEPLIGPFAQTLLLRTDVSGDPSFLELLGRVSVVNGSDPIRAHFVCHHDFVRPWKHGGLLLQPLPPKSRGARYDLNFSLTAPPLVDREGIDREKVCLLSCEYKTDLYDAETAQGLLASYAVLLDAILADPTRRLSEYQLPLPNQRARRVEPAPYGEGQGQDPLEAKLTAIWESILDKKPIGRNDDFFEIGGHLVLAARMFARIEEVLGRSLPVAALFQSPTIEKLAALLRDEPISTSHLVPVRIGGARSPFFFVHPAGSNVLAFAGFASHLDPDQPLYGLNPPCVASIEEMAEGCIAEIQRVQPRGPYHLGGFLSGGIVAFEMARKLRESGENIGVLALVNTRIELPSPLLLKRLSDWMWKTRHALGMSPGKLAPEEVFLLALHRYSPLPYDGGALLFHSEGSLLARSDPTLGWADLIRGDLQVHTISGEEERLLEEPHIGRFARLLSTFLLAAHREEKLVAMWANDWGVRRPDALAR